MGRKRADIQRDDNLDDGPSERPEQPTAHAADPSTDSEAALAALDAARVSGVGKNYPERESDEDEPTAYSAEDTGEASDEVGNDEVTGVAAGAAPRRRLKTPTRPGPKSLHPMFLNLAKILEIEDPAAVRSLSKLDYGRTSIVLQKLGGETGIDVINESPRLPLNRFAPDFLQTLLLSTPTERMTVTVYEKDEDGDEYEPWSFCVVLPPEALAAARKSANAAPPAAPSVASVAAPIPAAPVSPPPGVDPSMFFMMQMQQQAQQQMQQFVQMMREDNARRDAQMAALMERASAPKPETEFEAKFRTLSLAMGEESLKEGLRAVRGERTQRREAMQDYLSDLKLLGQMKKEVIAASEEFAELAPEPAAPSLADQLLGFAAHPAGQMIVEKIFGGGKAATPQIAPDAAAAQERLEAYG